MRILITGADGFIGQNLCLRLIEKGHSDLARVTEMTPPADLADACTQAEFVFHLAGVNRPKNELEFHTGNADFTRELCGLLAKGNRAIPIVFTSSTQAALDNPYGHSKKAAEDLLLKHGEETGASVCLFRLTNVFGKFCRPYYNSAVATFCHNIARGLPITIHDPAAALRLIHVDDVIDAFLSILETPMPPSGFHEAGPVYDTTVGELAQWLKIFADSRHTRMTPHVGTGFLRALYSTYLSYLPTADFAYPVPCHTDPRGEFVEVLRTPDCGQFSYFTAHPGITRGEHYHHSKTEKFLVIRGTARFGFRHITSGETLDLTVAGGEGRIVETVPGWTHNVTNIGDDELIVMLWANELFDPTRPDTIAMKVHP